MLYHAFDLWAIKLIQQEINKKITPLDFSAELFYEFCVGETNVVDKLVVVVLW